MALQAVGAVFTDLGNAVQQREAESAFYAKLPEIMRALQTNPGMGVLVEFVFHRPEPIPDSVILPGDQFQFVSFDVAASPRDVKAGIYPAQKGMELRIRRRWIPPVRPAPEAGTTGEARAALAVTRPEDLDALVGLVRRQGKTATDVALAFMAAKKDFGGVHVDVGNLSLELTHPLYNQALPRLQQAAAAALARSLDTLDARLRDVRVQYDKFSQEGWFTKRWHGRDFDLPPPTLLDNAADYARLSREALGKADLSLSRMHLRSARELIEKVESTLYRYLHGRPPPWEDA
jgi:hypothetical protein